MRRFQLALPFTKGMIDKVELRKRIGLKIIALRKERGISQAELARLCEKDKQTIEKIERGRHSPTVQSLYEVAQALGIKLTDIFSGIDE